MNKICFKLASVLLALLVVGCATVKPPETPEPDVISKTSYVFVAIPDNLMTNCKTDAPPSVSEYLAADWSNKEAVLTVYIKSLIASIASCNTKFSSLRKWNQSQKNIYSNDAKGQ